MDLEVVQYKDIERDVWNSFVNDNSMGYAYHLYDVVDLDRWENDKNRSFVFVDKDTREILLLSMLHLEYHEKTNRYRLHSRWGFVEKDGLSDKQLKQIQRKYIEYIDGICNEYDIESFDIAFPALCQRLQPQNGLSINPGLYYAFKPGVRYTYLVDLKKSTDQIIADFERSTRYQINKIQEGGRYRFFEPEINEDNYKIYYDQHVETYTRSGGQEAIFYDAYPRNIFFNLSKRGVCRIFFVEDSATKKIVSNMTILVYKNTAYYWWGGSANDIELGVYKWTLYNAMMTIKKDYSENYDIFYFETGGAHPYLKSGKFKGLNDFKKLFGTFLHPVYTGEYMLR